MAAPGGRFMFPSPSGDVQGCTKIAEDRESRAIRRVRVRELLFALSRGRRYMNQSLWVVDPRQVAFLCSCKEKLPKESTPRMAQTLLALLGLGPSPNHSTSLYCDSGADILSAPLTGSPQRLAMLRHAPYGDPTANPTHLKYRGHLRSTRSD